MEEIRKFLRDNPPNFQHAKLQKIEQHIYHIKVDIHKG